MRTLLVLAAWILAAAGPAAAADTATAGPPAAAAGRAEIHGLFRSSTAGKAEPFWARLLPADAALDGHRMLQVVYAAPPRATMAGSVLVDHPFVLVDAHLRLVAWNGRDDSLTRVVELRGSAGYQATREIQIGEGKEARIDQRQAIIRCQGRAWEEHLAPLLLAFTWRAGQSGAVGTVDSLGTGRLGRWSWRGDALEAQGRSWRIERDARGRLGRLVDEREGAVLVVAGWIADPGDAP